MRTRKTPVLLCLLVSLCGCAAQRFLRVDERRYDQHLRLFIGGGGNSVLLAHGSEAFLVDTKFGGPAETLHHRAEVELGRAVRRAVLTHVHVDHSRGLQHFQHLGAVLVHPTTRRRLEAEGVRAAFIEVIRPLRLVLGDEVVRVWHPGRGHTDGDLVVYLEGRKLLVTGDLLTELNEPVIDEANGGNALALKDTLNHLLEVDFVLALPGHGELVGREAFVRARDYLAQVEREVREARRQGWSPDDMVAKLTLTGAPEFESVPFRANREKTIRSVERALSELESPESR